MRQVCMWVTWHCVRACAGSHAGMGLSSLTSSDALRSHMTEVHVGSPRAPGGWALHPLIPRRVHQDPLQGVVP